jgi:hypothetical protein
MGNGFFKSFILFFHDVGDDEGGGLYGYLNTLEIPAAQWTSILPFAILFWMTS